MVPSNRIGALSGLGWALAVLQLGFLPCWADEPLRVVLIVADDLGYGELGCYGQAKIRTPHLDQLAAEGIRLTQHYAGAPVCAPSRCVLLTGRNLANAPIRNNRASGRAGSFPGEWPLQEGTWTFARVFQNAGYATGVFGKWGLGPVDSTGAPFRQGFDEFFGYECQRLAHSYYPPYLHRNLERVSINEPGIPGHVRQPEGEVLAEAYRGTQYAPNLMIDEALAFMEANAQRPFLLYLPLIEPHLAMHPPQAWIDLYPESWDEGFGPYRGENGYLPHPRPRAAYAAMISHLDHHVGRIMEKLEALGLTNRTLVVFTSDNGPTHGGRDPRFSVGGADCEFFESTGGLRGFKGSCYEGGLRVPCIVRWPGRIEAGTVCDVPSHFADWFPTLCAAASLSLPADVQLDGCNLLPILETGQAGHLQRDVPMLWEFHGYGGWVAARRGDWKLVRRQVASEEPGPWELYDLAVDPTESNDVSDQHPEIVRQIVADYQRLRSPAADFPWPCDHIRRGDEWESLFDGATLEGWTPRGGAARFFVEDGVIVGETVPNTPNTFLCSGRTWSDFVLELEFHVDRALNSGVQIRSQSLPEYRQGAVHGYQVEIDPSDRGWTGGIYDESRRGWLHDLSRHRRARYAMRHDAWNHLRIAAVGDRIRTWLNGVPAADLRDGMTREGFIALQVHGVGGREDPLRVRFRRIRLWADPPLGVLAEESPTAEPPSEIFVPGVECEEVAAGFRFAEGPTVGSDGAIFFSDIPNDRIHRFDPSAGELEVYREPSGMSNGLALTAGGALIACESQTRVVARLDGGQRRVLAESFEGRRLNSPNDIVPDGWGGFYFTDPRYGDRQSMELDFEGVFYIDRQGRLRLIERNLTRPNGLALSPDETRLYVADHAAGAIYVYEITGPGAVGEPTLFANVGSDGMTVDAFGNVFVTWGRDVIVFSSAGAELQRVTLPEPPTNCVLRGADLYVTSPTKLYRIRTRTSGME